MRIALDLRCVQDRFPGIGRYAFNLAAALPRVAPEVAWTYVYDSRTLNTRHDIGSLAGLPGVEMRAAPVGTRSLAEQVELPRLARRLSVDLWHAPYYVMPYRLGVPAVLTFYDAIARRFPETLAGGWMRPLFEVLTRLAVRSSRRFAAISRASGDDLARFYRVDPARVAVTHLGVDARFYPRPEAEVAEVAARLGLGRPYVLYLASNKPHKNLVRLLQAWSLVAADRSIEPCQLVIAGHWDPRFPEAREAARRLGLMERVQFAGEVEERDLPAAYSGARLFVFPSLYEGFGLPVLEAMACGAPVICANTSSLPEVAGDAAMQVDPLDVQGLAAAMARALADEAVRAGLRERGLLRAAEFTWERTASATLALYRSALEAG